MYIAYLNGAVLATGTTELQALLEAIRLYEFRFLPTGQQSWDQRMGRGELIRTIHIRKGINYGTTG